MRIARLLLKGLGALLLVVAVALGGWALLPEATAPIAGSNAIAAVERVELGGVPQTILLRGRDRSRPVLLFVHGGPGFGQLPIARRFSDLLEQHFVVVNWDDWNTPFALVEEWAAALEAPLVEIVWFQDAGHFASIEAPEVFQRLLIEKLTPLAPR